MNDIQELIQQLRTRSWTIAAVATEMSAPPNTVDRWYQGTRYPANVAGVQVILERLLQRQAPKRRRAAKVAVAI